MRRRMMMMKNVDLESVITINQTINDPFSRVSGDVNGAAIQWIREKSHRYLGKYKDGVMYICQLDDSNSNYYYDGTSANLTGLEGDVFVKLPEFYYYGTEGNTVNIYFANYQVNSSYVRWDPNILIGAYEAYVTSSKLYSRSGVYPTGSYSYNQMASYCTNRGAGYQFVDWQMHCVLGCLYYAMYGNTNCQNTIGIGLVSYNNISGDTSILGMRDTVYNGTNSAVNFWGLENWWGNKFEILYDGRVNSGSYTMYVYDPISGYERRCSIFEISNKCIVKMKFGKYLDLIATSDGFVSGSSDGYCDGADIQPNYSSGTLFTRHNRLDPEWSLGVASSQVVFNRDYAHPGTSTRLAFRGICIEETNVSTFKNIAISN